MESTGTRSSNELWWLKLQAGHEDSGLIIFFQYATSYFFLFYNRTID